MKEFLTQPAADGYLSEEARRQNEGGVKPFPCEYLAVLTEDLRISDVTYPKGTMICAGKIPNSFVNKCRLYAPSLSQAEDGVLTLYGECYGPSPLHHFQLKVANLEMDPPIPSV